MSHLFSSNHKAHEENTERNNILQNVLDYVQIQP